MIRIGLAGGYSRTFVIWTSHQKASAGPAYPSLRISIVQSGSGLSGTIRDEIRGVDVLVSSGSINDTGNVDMTVVLSDGGSLRQILIYRGQVTGSGVEQQIFGTYTALNPCESGGFVMTHE